VPSLTLIRYFYSSISGWPWPLGSHEVITQRVSPAIFNIMGPNTLGSRTWPFKITWRHRSRATIFNRFQDICIQIYLGHDLDLSGSRDITGHVTIWFPRCRFLYVLCCNRVSVSSHFWDNEPETDWCHDLDFSSSRDVIMQSRRFAICHFLLVSHWNWVSIFNRFRDVCIQIYLGHDLDLSGPRDVTGHVTLITQVPFPIGALL